MYSGRQAGRQVDRQAGRQAGIQVRACVVERTDSAGPVTSRHSMSRSTAADGDAAVTLLNLGLAPPPPPNSEMMSLAPP